MVNDIVILSNLSEGQRIKITRLSKELRQIDLAAIAKVNIGDICAAEKDRFLRKTRKERIMQALGLLDQSEAQHGN